MKRVHFSLAYLYRSVVSGSTDSMKNEVSSKPTTPRSDPIARSYMSTELVARLRMAWEPNVKSNTDLQYTFGSS